MISMLRDIYRRDTAVKPLRTTDLSKMPRQTDEHCIQNDSIQNVEE